MAKEKAEAAASKATIFRLPKQYRVIGAMGRGRGLSRRSFTRPMAEAHANYEGWRKTGFKGAWWWQYFKQSDAE